MARVGHRSVNNRAVIEIPLMPPSVNHYVVHPAAGVHRKSAAAKAFESAFGLFVRGEFCLSASGRFSATLEFWPGPRGKGDVDNYNKLPLDCAATAGMLRDAKGKEKSDAWIKRLAVEIYDSDEQRLLGPKMRLTIEAL